MLSGRRSEVVSSVDTAWLRMEARNNLMMITGVMSFAGQMDMARLRDTLESRFLRYDRFRQRIAHGVLPSQGPRWELDPHFSLDHHVHRFRLPAPGDQATLQKYVSYMMSQPLDFT